MRTIAANDRSTPVETPSEAFVSDMERAPGGVRGHYQLLRQLGRGGQATSVLARDTRLERLVVLKCYHGSAAPERRESVLAEGRALARVRSRYGIPIAAEQKTTNLA
jgi:serine/threonine protein kinase